MGYQGGIVTPAPLRPGESDQSVIRPMPGGRKLNAARSTGAAGTMDLHFPAADPIGFVMPSTSRNPILAAASALLAIAPQIRHSTNHPDPHRLKDELASGIQDFEQHASAARVPRASVVAARYILCTFLDECAASTPWGSGGVWARDTLLVRLHSETWGGEKVFQLLTRLAQDPKQNVDLLELIYVCLSLGFEGRYRVADNGRSQLETIRERLYQMVQQQRGETDRTLSTGWRPARLESRRWIEMTPLWVFLALCLATVAATFITYRALLNIRSDPVFAMLQGIKPPPSVSIPAAAPSPLPVPPAQARLRRFLETEVTAGLVNVQETADKSIVTIRGDGLFEPGSAQVNKAVLPLLVRIATALRDNPGMVLVDGHTDSQPIRSVRFPSNFHLSQERADGVAKILASTIGAQRIRTDGKAASEPIAANDTPAGRSQNRRVTITLLANQRSTQ